MKAFVTAAKAAKTNKENEEDAISFTHDGRDVKFYQPSVGQQAVMMGMSGSDLNVSTASDFIALFFEMMDNDTQKYFKSRLLDREDSFELDGDGGMMDIYSWLAEQWSGKPTKPASGSRSSASKTGKGSTAPTRAKGSTSSRSRSTASSQ